MTVGELRKCLSEVPDHYSILLEIEDKEGCTFLISPASIFIAPSPWNEVRVDGYV